MTEERLGPAGETFAVKWLERRGYSIITRNWRIRSGERRDIDLL